MPVPIKSGVSNGFLRPAYGLVSVYAGGGSDRGGINWNGTHYRVQGSNLISINASGFVTVLGAVQSGGWCSFDYSFDRLAIAAGGHLYYWNGSALTQVTDADLGNVVDALWVDGYFMTTDGTSLVVTELTDPTAVNPLKYGSSEVDPDPVKALKKIRGEVYAVNRYTTEVFSNVGGEFFPFSRVDGAQIPKGAIGTHAVCVFSDVLAFLGSGRNEPPAIYMGASGSVEKISTQEIDKVLATYTEAQLQDVVLEAKQDATHLHLYIHLPDRCLVYDLNASKAVGEMVWFTLTSALVGFAEYKGKGHVWAYDKWWAADPATGQVGYLTDDVSSHFGTHVRWEFGTICLYNEGKGAVINQAELVPLSGHVALSDDPQISMSYSNDGELWSAEKSIKAGKTGERVKRLCWFQCGMMRNWRILRFSGDSRAHMSFLRLDIEVEKLVY